METFDESRLPCLFERLIDHHPDQHDESRHFRTLSISDYRMSIIRDLRWLFNAARRTDGDIIYSFPHAKSSVLNFGCRDLTGLSSKNFDAYDLEMEFRNVILTFEPRIIPETLSVKMVTSELDSGQVSFEIQGHIWALPHPELLYVRTEMDLDTGIAVVKS